MLIDQSKMQNRFSKFVQTWDGASLSESLLRDAKLDIYSDQQIAVYYLPEFVFNEKASVYLLGITPGWTQLTKFYQMYQQRRDAVLRNGELSAEVRLHGAFAGSMRKNLIHMLDDIGLHKKLGIESNDELFSKHSDRLMTGSVLHHPVFANGKNYTGHGPAILKHEALRGLAVMSLEQRLSLFKGELIVPLGIAAQEVLKHLVGLGALKENKCLFGFPHPSGANGHRHMQFEQEKSRMSAQIKQLFA